MKPRSRAGGKSNRKTISLFSGAGGLDVGLEAAGFSVAVCVEIDGDARKTLETNHPQWKLADPADIHRADPSEVLAQGGLSRGNVALLAGGPPCQPFSKSANWSTGGTRGLRDPRADTLGRYLAVVEAALPQVILLENVRGLASGRRQNGAVDFLQAGLEGINERHGTAYQLQAVHVNAASYGVPQLRERVFILASIDGRLMSPPRATHGELDGLAPYRTAWDAIGDLDAPEWPAELRPTGKWGSLLASIPEGRNYLWHTPRGGGEPLFGWRTRYWSFLLKLAKNRPSWTIQAEPGPATGPFHWRSRALSTDELARLQTFPDGYVFACGRRAAQRQIGNAVPCALGELLGREIRRQLLDEANVPHRLRLIPDRRADCPPEEPLESVPSQYMVLRDGHAGHPGTGLGPGRVWNPAENVSETGV